MSLAWRRRAPNGKKRTNQAGVSRPRCKRNIAFRLLLEPLEDRTMLSTVTWIGGSGDWSTGSNWSNGTGPGAGDDAVINLPGISVTHSSGSDTVKSVSMNDPFALSGGTLTVTGSVQEQTGNPLTLAGGTLSRATVVAGTTVTSAGVGGTLDDVTLAGTLDLSTADELHVAVSGGLTLQGGTIKLATDTMDFQGTQTLGGTGTVDFVGTNQYYGVLNVSGTAATLTIAPGVSIHGTSGSIEAGANRFVNQGTITADSNGRGLDLDGTGWVNQGTIDATGGTFNLYGSWTNAGTIAVSAAATLDLGGTFGTADLGTLDRIGGTVNLTGTLTNTGTLSLDATSGSWVLEGGEIVGGTVATAGGAELLATYGGSLAGVTLAGTLDLATADELHVAVTGGLTLQGGTIKLATDTIDFQGTQTLGGTGTVDFVGTNQYYGVLNVSGTAATLTIAPGVSIHGTSGSIEAGDNRFVNQGKITADANGRGLDLDGTGWVNQGTIDANGGTFNLYGSWNNAGTIAVSAAATLDLGGTFGTADLGTLDRTGGTVNLTGTLTNTGTLSLDATSGSWVLQGGEIVGGTVATAGGAELLATYGGSLAGVTLAGTLDLATADELHVAVTGGLTLQGGTIKLATDTIDFQGTQTLGGTGTVDFVGTNQYYGVLNVSGTAATLTIAHGVSIHGTSGSIEAGDNRFVNQGKITADANGRGLDLDGTGWINQGTIDANGGTVNLTGSWTNAGTIAVSTAVTLDLGGSIGPAALGTITSAHGIIFLEGTLDNRGSTLALDDTTGSFYLLGGTILGGTVTTSGSAALLGSTNGATLAGVTLAGTLDLYGAPLFYNGAVTVTGGLTLDQGSVNIAASGSLTFQGTQTLGGTGSVTFANAIAAKLVIPGNGDLLTIAQGITMQGDSGFIGSNTGGAFLNQGTIKAIGGGTVTVQGDTNFAGGTLTGGHWQATAGSTLRLLGADIVTNAASILLDGPGATLYSDNGTTDALDGLAGNALTGSLAIQNGFNLATRAAFNNEGSLTIGAGSVFTAGGNYTTGGSTIVDGSLAASDTVTVNSGGRLAGSGTVTANVVNQGVVSPGDSPGILTIDGDYMQASTAALAIEVGGTTVGTQYDRLAVSGVATLNGTTDVSLINGFGPSSGQVFGVMGFGSSSGAFATVNIPLLGGLPAFLTESAPTTFNLVTATMAADLSVDPTSITATPASAGPGQPVTVNYTLKNQGTVPVPAGWTDSVYLSSDITLSANDLLLGRITHDSALAALGSMSESLSAPLPGASDGNYHVIVVADSRLQVADVNRANNTVDAAAALAVKTPALVLGTPVSGTIADGQDLYFRLLVAPSQDVQIAADFTISPEAEFYVRYGALPDRSNFDREGKVTDLHQQLALLNPQGGAYYILLHGREGAAGGLGFTIRADAVPLQITSVTPVSAGNTGQATLTIAGTHFSSQTVVSLQAADGSLRFPITSHLEDTTTFVATFDLTGVAEGAYSVRVDDNGQTATLASSLTIDATPPGQFVAAIVSVVYVPPSPQGLSFGIPSQLTVQISNPGGTDALAGMFVLKAQNAIMDLDGQSGTSLAISLPGASGSSLILPPHFKTTITVGWTPIIDSPDAGVSFSLYSTGAPDSVIDWNSEKALLRPSYIAGDAWDAVFANFTAVVGTTLGQYQAVLAEDASYLDGLGEKAIDPSQLLEFELAKADDVLAVPILTSTLDASFPSPGLPLDFSRSFLQSLSGRYQPGALGRGWTFTGDMSAVTDARGNVTILADGAPRGFTLQPDGSYVGDPGDFATLTRESGAYRLQETSGTIIGFRPDGLYSFTQDPNGNKITAGYNDGGSQMTSLAASNGAALTLSYNAQGRLSQITDPAGRIVSYAYDATGEELTSVTGPSGTVSYSYLSGQGAAKEYALASITNADGTHQYFDYDAQGRLIGTHADDNAAAVGFSYVSSGGVKTTDATGASQTVFYNELFQPAQIEDPLGEVQQLTYNAKHQLVGTQFVGGPRYSFAYDSQGNVSRVVDPLGQSVNLTFNSEPDRLSTLLDQNGNARSYSYDGAGDLTATVSPDGSAAQVAYDAEGQATQTTNARGQAISYTYDSRGLVTREDFPDGSHADFSYDAHGNLISASDSSGSTLLQYDSADRLTSITYPGGQFLQFAYDSGGRRTRSVDQDGFTNNYFYDSAGRLSKLTDGSNALIVAYTYDATGRLARKDMGNGTSTTFSYDLAGNLLHLVNLAPGGSVNSQFDYTYDSLGRRASMTSADGMTKYGYDALGQLISVSLPGGGSIEYTYDGAGNRVAEVDNGATTDYASDSNDQYLTIGESNNSFDADGNLVLSSGPGGNTAYTYDAQGRLIGVNSATDTWIYKYDALGNRISSTHNGQTTQYLVDPLGLGNVVGEYDATGKTIADYTYGVGLTSRVDSSNAAAYYDFDATGSTTGLTGQLGGYLNSYSYLPFGTVQSTIEKFDNPFQYDGQSGVMALGNGLDFMRARFFDPSTGRFLNPDPSGLAGGSNSYAYAANNPISFQDPSGLQWGLNPNSYSVGTGFGGRGVATTVSTGERALLVLEAAGKLVESGGPVAIVLLAVADIAIVGAVLYTGTQAIKEFVSWQWPVISNGDGKLLSTAYTTLPGPLDPNFITGPSGFGSQGFLTAGATLPYVIGFENEADATAPAQFVDVTQQLDPDLDLSTFQLGDFAFGGMVYSIPTGRTEYSVRIDARRSVGVFVDVDAQLNPVTGIVRWTFTSIDPTTLDEPIGEVEEGFLPPDVTPPQGQGLVMYTVEPKAGISTGTIINAKAAVVFNTNDPVITVPIFNTIDSCAPTSSVAALPADSPDSFTVSWAGQDDSGGSGINSFDVYVSDDGGQFTLWQSHTSATSANFSGAHGHTYGFYSVATDNVGLVQANAQAAQATTKSTQSDPRATTLSSISGTGAYSGTATVSATLTAGGSPLTGKTVAFTWNVGGTMTSLGSATTNASGIATLAGIKLAGVNAGTYVGAVAASFAGDDSHNASVGSGNLIITSRPVPPVTVLGIHWQTRKLAHKKTAKVLVVGFSGALDPRDARSPSAYHLVSAGKDKKFGTRDDKSIPIASLTYDPLAHTMTLKPRGTIPNQSLQLGVRAALTLDALGRPIDGNRDGQPGGDFKAQFGKRGVNVATTFGSGPASRVFTAAFDVLLARVRLARHRTERHS